MKTYIVKVKTCFQLITITIKKAKTYNLTTKKHHSILIANVSKNLTFFEEHIISSHSHL